MICCKHIRDFTKGSIIKNNICNNSHSPTTARWPGLIYATMTTYTNAEIGKIEKRHWKDGFKMYRTKKRPVHYDDDRKVLACVSLALFVNFNWADTCFPSHTIPGIFDVKSLTVEDDGRFSVSYISNGEQRNYSSQYKIADYFYSNKQLPPPNSWWYM